MSTRRFEPSDVIVGVRHDVNIDDPRFVSRSTGLQWSDKLHILQKVEKKVLNPPSCYTSRLKWIFHMCWDT